MLNNRLMGTSGAAFEGFQATISTNQQEMNLATWANSQGWNGTDAAQITLSSNTYIWSDNTAIAALTTGNFPNGLNLIVEGFIIGKGGNGAPMGIVGSAGSGGPAILLDCNITIIGTTSGYIGGGGGGGGSTQIRSGGGNYSLMAGGGGAGGGNGGDANTISGGIGGSIGVNGSSGSSSNTVTQQAQGGGSGGGGAGGDT